MTRYRRSISPNEPGRTLRVRDGVTYQDTIIQKLPRESVVTYDEVIKDYKLRSARGEIFNNPYTNVKTYFFANDEYASWEHLSGVNWTHTHSNGAISSSMWAGMDFPAAPIDSSDADARARIECIGSVNKTEADAGAFLGEWSKTKLIHREVLSTLWKIITKEAKVVGKRGSFQKVMLYNDRGSPLLGRNGKPLFKYAHVPDSRGVNSNEKAKNSANLYLQWRMAISPLLQELEGACKIISGNRALRQTARATYTESSHASVPWSLADGYSWVWTGVLDTWRVRTVRYGILYESSQAGRMVAQLGLSRPLSTAWELVPWSFVFDWLFEVGKWLDAIQPSFASKTLSAWVSTQDTHIKQFTIGGSKTFREGTRSAGASWSGQAQWKEVSKTRTPWAPAVPFAPILGTGLSTMRSFDLAALMLQKIKTRF